MASRMLCSGLMTRRLTAIMAPNVKPSAEASSTSCNTSERRAAECWLEVWSLAASRAASATLTALLRRPTVIGVHWFAVNSGFPPAISVVSRRSRKAR